MLPIQPSFPPHKKTKFNFAQKIFGKDFIILTLESIDDPQQPVLKIHCQTQMSSEYIPAFSEALVDIIESKLEEETEVTANHNRIYYDYEKGEFSCSIAATPLEKCKGHWMYNEVLPFLKGVSKKDFADTSFETVLDDVVEWKKIYTRGSRQEAQSPSMLRREMQQDYWDALNKAWPRDPVVFFGDKKAVPSPLNTQFLGVRGEWLENISNAAVAADNNFSKNKSPGGILRTIFAENISLHKNKNPYDAVSQTIVSQLQEWNVPQERINDLKEKALKALDIRHEARLARGRG